ncbi:acyl-ACP--UDP-N-acetylglucosamine O-acyltransferase [Lutimaribacter marinistellae]|uniref:Acyl-[acyl-carrier-protein]--UDP-N-acetylglucosamine O-acyltransferase n=1 Tax=Lutimaribacter marinistellae TaxID=1820329 RepID=A0ABV7TQP3_9RHOB
MSEIHPTAIIEEGAQVGADCVIGAYCVIGSKVRLGDRVELKPHVVVTGDTEIGEDTTIYSFSVIGEIPQDKKFGGEDTKLVIGKRNRIREHVTMNCGTEGGGGITRVGDDGLFMAGCHIAHDCQVGDRVIVVNQVALAGHVVLGDDAIIGGLSGVHQFVRVGKGAIVGGLTKVTHDVIPYGQVQAAAGSLVGLNLVGLRRRGVPREDISALRDGFKALAGSEGSFQDRARALRDSTQSAYVREITDFILSDSDRSFHTPKV